MPGLIAPQNLRAKKAAETVLLCAATSWEARPLSRLWGLAFSGPRLYSGTFSGRGISLLQTGIGEASLLRTLETLPREAGFTRIISSGFCGALRPDMRPADIICDFASSDAEAERSARRIAAAYGRRIYFGRITHSKKIASPEMKKSLSLNPEALAVDMETEPLRSWAKIHHPSAAICAVRTILDELGERLPEDFPEAGGLAPEVFYALTHPKDWASLAALYFKQRKAAQALAEFLREFLGNLP